MLFISGLIMLIIGIVMAVAPEKYFEIMERLSWEIIREPADKYVFSICAQGAFIAILGIVVIIIGALV